MKMQRRVATRLFWLGFRIAGGLGRRGRGGRRGKSNGQDRTTGRYPVAGFRPAQNDRRAFGGDFCFDVFETEREPDRERNDIFGTGRRVCGERATGK